MKSTDFWDREVAAPTHVSWLEDAQVRDYVNTLMGGWPLDWFTGWLGSRRFDRALSIGCGTGALERDLIRRGLCRTVDAFDGSVTSLHAAIRAAKDEGALSRIRYFASDFNRPALPGNAYDVVFFHQSAHHVAKLEKLYRAVLGALRPDGLVYLDEYVGPSAPEWNQELLAPHQRVYERLDPSVRSFAAVTLPVKVDDPSEAFRSSEIESQLAVGFDTVARRPYGGTLLSVLFRDLRREAVTPELVRRLIETEKEWLTNGAASYYTLIVARPKSGWRKVLARAHYFLVPKLKRVLRMMLL